MFSNQNVTPIFGMSLGFCFIWTKVDFLLCLSKVSYVSFWGTLTFLSSSVHHNLKKSAQFQPEKDQILGLPFHFDSFQNERKLAIWNPVTWELWWYIIWDLDVTHISFIISYQKSPTPVDPVGKRRKPLQGVAHSVDVFGMSFSCIICVGWVV